MPRSKERRRRRGCGRWSVTREWQAPGPASSGAVVLRCCARLLRRANYPRQFGGGAAHRRCLSEAFVITIEVVQVLRGEMEPARFSGTYGLLQSNFGTEGAVIVLQVQDLDRVRHR